MQSKKKILFPGCCLFIFILFFYLSIPVSASTTLSSEPYAKVEYGYSADVSAGTVRYISQNVNSGYFKSSYWGKWEKQASIECGTSCISMALSYVGVNKTPLTILNAHNGSTYFDGWGVTYKTPSFATAMSNYLNGKGKYSPPVIHLSNYSLRGHFVLVVGKGDGDNYVALDPYNDSLWNLTIRGNLVSYKKSGVNKTDTISGELDVRQYYNSAVSITIQKPEETKDPQTQQPQSQKPQQSQQPAGTSNKLKKGTLIKEEAGNALYKVTTTKKQDVSKVEYLSPLKAKKTIIIPAKIKVNGVKYKVTSIRENAFKNNKILTRITIPAGLREMGKNVFYGCKNLKKIYVKSSYLSYKTIGNNAFYKMNTKAKIEVPSGKVSYYRSLFRRKGLSKNVRLSALLS